jgi:hypothetical protein
MAERTELEIEAELASILRRPPDDPVRRNLESLAEGCEVMAVYARHAEHLLPKDGMACEPRKCEECGELFTPPLDPGALYCSTPCRRKAAMKRVLADRELLAEYRQRYPAERDSQPT